MRGKSAAAEIYLDIKNSNLHALNIHTAQEFLRLVAL